MKVGDLVRLSKKARGQKQNYHLLWDDVGFVIKDMSRVNLFCVKWFAQDFETMHYRYELRFAK